MAPTLKPVLTIRLRLDPANTLALGTSVAGGTQRMVCPLLDGSIRGEGIQAKLLPGSSENPLVDETGGVSYIDGRCHFREEGTEAAFYVRATGVVQLDAAAKLAFTFDPAAKTTAAGDHTWSTTMTFEVSNEDHKWLERNWFVTQGHWQIPGDGSIWVQHDVYMMIKG